MLRFEGMIAPFLLMVLVLPAQAQPFRPINPRPVEPLIPVEPPSLPQIPLSIPEQKPSIPEKIPDIPGTVIIKKFNFVGNTVFSKKDLTQQLTDLIGKPITFSDLLQAEAIITKLYVEQGYLNSGAVIAAGQEIDNGEVTITIIEGRIEDIVVEGTQRLSPDFIRSRLASDKPFNREALLEALQLLQLNPLIATVKAELSTGSRPELSRIKVTVTEADSFGLSLNLDNNRVPSIGTFERGISLSEINLLGFGDALNIAYNNTDGSNSVDASYSIYTNSNNGTLKLAGGFNNTHVIEPPFDRLDITGDSRYYELTLRQPLINRPTEELGVGLTISREESETTLLGDKFPLSRGANEDGETRILAVRFFQDWVNRNPTDILALRSQFSFGIDTGENTSSEPNGSFFAWRAQGQYVKQLAPNTLWVVRSDLQVSDRPLLALEQFALGGDSTVRGYRQDLLVTDNGFLLSSEVRITILRVPEWQGILQIVPFVDFGVGWNNTQGSDPDPNSLVGVGLGLQWTVSDSLSARFDWGIPLIEVKGSDTTWQENGIYFTINYNFF